MIVWPELDVLRAALYQDEPSQLILHHLMRVHGHQTSMCQVVSHRVILSIYSLYWTL